MKFDPKDKSRFWLELTGKNKETGKIEGRGQIKMQFDVLPVDQADKNKIGKAREQPNHSPTFPEPEGRFELSLNPFKMFNQMVGPEVRCKIYTSLACALCIVLILAIAPNIMGAIIANMFT